MRLIDADALKRIILSEGSYQNMVGVLEEEIDNAPTVDAVEVVRCKDCTHAEKMKPRLGGKIVVFCYLHKRERFVLSDGYCESGKRRK